MKSAEEEKRSPQWDNYTYMRNGYAQCRSCAGVIMVAKVEGECCSRVVKVGHQCDACGKVMLVDCNSAISNMKSHEDGKRHKARIDLLDKETVRESTVNYTILSTNLVVSVC